MPRVFWSARRRPGDAIPTACRSAGSPHRRVAARSATIWPRTSERLRLRAAQADAIGAWIAAIVDGIPAPAADGRIDLQSIVATAAAFVRECTARASALDAAAATSLAEAIGELDALGQFRCRLDQALRFLRERVDRVSIGADRARPGHLHISALSQAGLANRRFVFVIGLEEGRVFPAPFEDPILLDEQREAIPTLPDRRTALTKRSTQRCRASRRSRAGPACA